MRITGDATEAMRQIQELLEALRKLNAEGRLVKVPGGYRYVRYED